MTQPSHQFQTPPDQGPARFAAQVEAEPPQRHLGEILGSLAALLALVVGLPALLIALAGPPPVPTSVPAPRDLAQQLGFEELITVLVAIVWITWAYFVVCVAVEVVAARRGGLGRPIPLAGPLQRLARVLVGAVLLSGIVAAPAQASVAPDTGLPTAVTGQIAEADAPDAGPPPPPAAADTSEAEVEDVPADLVGERVYTVKAPNNGYHDNLWDIAERHLGDGFRYKEIFELNQDRLQADGRTLELARLIQPGWQLILPDDATGVDVMEAPQAGSDAVAETMADAEAGASAPGAVAEGAGDGAGSGGSGGPGGSSGGATDLWSSNEGRWAVGGSVLAGSVLLALLWQRRRQLGRTPDDAALEFESELRMAASLDRCAWIDAALRDLGRTCRRESIALPAVYAAFVDDSRIELLLAPASQTAAPGWEAVDNGRRWRRERPTEDLQIKPEDRSPFPGLLSIGRDEEGRDVLIDVEAAGGVIALDGDLHVAGEVASALAVQAATVPWADDTRVTAAGLPGDLAAIAAGRITSVTDPAATAAALSEEASVAPVDVLTGRLQRSSLPTHLVVWADVPDEPTARLLESFVAGSRAPRAVVSVGRHTQARWTLTVDSSGTVRLPLFDVTVQAHTLTASEATAAAALFEATTQHDDPGGDDGRVVIPRPLRDHDDAAWAQAPTKIGVLGPLVVRTAGSVPEDRAAQAAELVTYLALHPEGVHPQVLAGVLWPRGVTDDVRDAAIARARDWLGADVDGSHLLRESAEGRLALAESVVCDWDGVRTLFVRSRTAGQPRKEAELLRRGLALVRGAAFADTPEGRFGWIAHDGLQFTMARVIVDAAERLAHLEMDHRDPHGAARAAQIGLRVNIGSQTLWRDLIRARHAADGAAGVQKTVAELDEALRQIPLEPQTVALIDELLPAGTGQTA